RRSMTLTSTRFHAGAAAGLRSRRPWLLPADPIAPIYSGRPRSRPRQAPEPGAVTVHTTIFTPRAHARDRCGLRAAWHGPGAYLRRRLATTETSVPCPRRRR